MPRAEVKPPAMAAPAPTLVLRGSYFAAGRPEHVRPAELAVEVHEAGGGFALEGALRLDDGALHSEKGPAAEALGGAWQVAGTVTLRLGARPQASWRLVGRRRGDGAARTDVRDDGDEAEKGEVDDAGDRADATITLVGAARPKWLVPIDSLTRVWLRIERDGDAIGMCLLRVDVRRDLIALLDRGVGPTARLLRHALATAAAQRDAS